MMRPESLSHLGQQFLLQRFLAQKPPPTNRSVAADSLLRPAPLFHRFFQSTPSRHTVLRYAILSQQPINPQPLCSFRRHPQIIRPTAPRVFSQRLPERTQKPASILFILEDRFTAI